MMDEDAIERRERIFNQLRQSQKEYDELNKQCEEISTRLSDLRQSSRDKKSHIEQLVKLIRVMIMYDCCPVEAQLKYPNELENDEDKPKIAAIQKASRSYGSESIGCDTSQLPQVGWF